MKRTVNLKRRIHSTNNTRKNHRHLSSLAAQTLGLTALLYLSFSQYALAEIYKSVGPDGRTIYTDVPGGKKITEVDLPTINATPSVQSQIYTYQKNVKLEAPVPDYQPSISYPANNTQIMPDQRDLNVSSSLGTQMREGDRAQLIINGQPVGNPQRNSNFTVKEIFRGQHTVRVAVIDKRGNIVKQSDPVTVTVVRPVVNRR